MRLVCAGCGRTADIQVNTDVDARTLKGTVLRTVETAGWTHTNGFDKLHCPKCSDRAFEADMYEAMKSLVGKARDGAWRGRALGDDTKRDIKRMADDLVSILRLNEEDERMDAIKFNCCHCNYGSFTVPYDAVISPTGVRGVDPPLGWKEVTRGDGTAGFICPSCVIDAERHSRMKSYHGFAVFVSGHPSAYTELELESIRADAKDVIDACDRVLNGLKWARGEGERMLIESKMQEHNGRIDYIVTLNTTMDTFTDKELAYIVRMTPNGVMAEPYYGHKESE